MVVNNFQTYNQKDDARQSARKVLYQLYEFLGKPDHENFYPVDLKTIATSILGYTIDEVGSIGQAKYGDYFSGESIIGKIDFKNKVISINVNDSSEAERNYTLAHEIGHLVLHKTSPSCHNGNSLRKRSARKPKGENNDEILNKLERQADTFASELLMPEKGIRTQFNKIFDREAVWSSSKFLKELREGEVRDFSRQRSFIDQSSPLDVASYLSTYKSTENEPSLTEFFKTSARAMRFRLLELRLVY